MSAAIKNDVPWLSQWCNSTPMNGLNNSITPNKLEELLSAVATGINTALYAAKNATDQYVRGVWNKSVEDHHRRWKQQKTPDWLNVNDQTLPKSFNDPLPEEHKQTLQDGMVVRNISDLLMDSFERFQRIAIGIEQIIADFKHDNSNFGDDMDELKKLEQMLDTIKNNVRLVLCDIEMVLMDHNIKMFRPPVYIDKYETLAKVRQNKDVLRNWIILREYVNLLEYNNESIVLLQDRIKTEIENGAIEYQIE